MPVSSGTLTATVYNVAPRPDPIPTESYQTALHKFGFRPINEERGEKIAGGWVNFRDMLNSVVTLEGSTIAPYIFLSLRIDKKRVAPNVLKATLTAKIRELMRERAGRPVSKGEKAALLEQVTMDLLRDAKATANTYEAVWDTAANKLYLATGSNSVRDMFAQYFADTFELGVEPANLLSRAGGLSRLAGYEGDLSGLSSSWWGTSTALASEGE